ncbi:hypothetical protein BVX97_03390 [bacterium E08(2017)]|nr:hypothetical protein BVX97_03390 [bacterium E08(2017)]
MAERVIVLGLGKSGDAAARLLLSEGAAVDVVDKKGGEALSERKDQLEKMGARVHLECEELPLESWDLCVLSPGVPYDSEWVQSLKSQVTIISEFELGASHCECPVIMITGTNGKSSLVKLCTDSLERAGRKVAAGGNYGVPVTSICKESAGLDLKYIGQWVGPNAYMIHNKAQDSVIIYSQKDFDPKMLTSYSLLSGDKIAEVEAPKEKIAFISFANSGNQTLLLTVRQKYSEDLNIETENASAKEQLNDGRGSVLYVYDSSSMKLLTRKQLWFSADSSRTQHLIPTDTGALYFNCKPKLCINLDSKKDYTEEVIPLSTFGMEPTEGIGIDSPNQRLLIVGHSMYHGLPNDQKATIYDLKQKTYSNLGTDKNPLPPKIIMRGTYVSDASGTFFGKAEDPLQGGGIDYLVKITKGSKHLFKKIDYAKIIGSSSSKSNEAPNQ